MNPTAKPFVFSPGAASWAPPPTTTPSVSPPIPPEAISGKAYFIKYQTSKQTNDHSLSTHTYILF